MRSFHLTILMALLWLSVSGELTLGAAIVGAAAGFIVLRMVGQAADRDNWVRQMARGLAFAGLYLFDALKSALRIAWDVVTPKSRMRPGVIRVPFEVESNVELVAIANLISLSPGTLTVDVSADEKTLYVHLMYLDRSLDEEREAIRDVERRVDWLLETGRREGRP